MKRLQIRPMLVEDVPAVCAVDRLCFPEPWPTSLFLSETTSPMSRFQVAVEDGEILGYLGGHLILDEAHVVTLGVHPDRRRQGIGERLLADFIEAALQENCRRITLEVRESNASALALYRRYGFQPISRRRQYYADNDEDAIVMWIEDTHHPVFQMRLAESRQRLAGAGA